MGLRTVTSLRSESSDCTDWIYGSMILPHQGMEDPCLTPSFIILSTACYGSFGRKGADEYY